MSLTVERFDGGTRCASRGKKGEQDPRLKIVNKRKKQKNGKPMPFPQQAREGMVGGPDEILV
jgi:hypothetical protein